MATGTIIVQSNDPEGEKTLPVEGVPLPFLDSIVFEKTSGSGTLVGITEFGDLSSPPRKYKVLQQNAAGYRRTSGSLSPDFVLPIVYGRVRYNDSGVVQDDRSLPVNGASAINGPEMIASREEVATNIGAAENPIRTLEEYAYAANGEAAWTPYPIDWQRSKTTKSFTGFTPAPGEASSIFPGMSLGNAGGGSGTGMGLRIEPVFLGDRWRLDITVGATGQPLGLAPGVSVWMRGAQGDQNPGTVTTSDELLFTTAQTVGGSGNVVELHSVEIPLNTSVRFMMNRSASVNSYGQIQVPMQFAAPNPDQVQARNHWYFPLTESEYVREYREMLGDEDTIGKALVRNGAVPFVVPVTEAVAQTSSYTGGVTAEGHDPIAVTAEFLDVVIAFKNLIPDHRHLCTLRRRINTIGDTDFTFEDEAFSFDTAPSATTHEEQRGIAAPVGKQVRLVRITLQDQGQTPPTPPQGTPGVPYFVELDTIVAPRAVSFTLQPLVVNAVVTYGATGLPPGLSINTSSGLISGNPTTIGIYEATITGTNSAGQGSVVYTFDVTPSPPPPVSSIPAADLSAAYGLRPLVSGYAGNLFRARRSNDNAEQDFAVGYTYEDLDEFRQGFTAFVVTLYDQSGNGKHKTQATAINQLALAFDAPGSHLSMVSTAAQPVWLQEAATLTSRACVAVMRPDAGSDDGAALVCNANNENLVIRKGFYGTARWDTFNYTSSIFVNGVATEIYTNGVFHVARFQRGSDGSFENPHRLFANNGTGNRTFNGRFLEVMFFNSSGAANASSVATDLFDLWLT